VNTLVHTPEPSVLPKEQSNELRAGLNMLLERVVSDRNRIREIVKQADVRVYWIVSLKMAPRILKQGFCYNTFVQQERQNVGEEMREYGK